jgi:S-phase kinase-associated protein 1
VDRATVFELINAANFLDIPRLLDSSCKVVANLLKGKTPEEIRKEFHIENDLSADEIKQILDDNEWCEDGV